MANTLLHIDSSPLGPASISRHLTAEFVENWKLANPGGKVIRRDLANIAIPTVSAEWVGAAYTPAANRTEAQRNILALSDTFISELREADEYVAGVPMHNFAPPASVKLWIDQIARAGETFSYGANGAEGLLKGKKATLVVASGGVYDADTAASSFNFVAPYLRAVFGFLGVTDISFVAAGGAAALNYGKVDRQTFLQPHVDSIRARFQAA
jgi:FMN-dependent NADH-azoreductase